MKKRYIVIAIVSALCIFTFFIIFISPEMSEREKSAESTHQSISYTVSEYEGKVAVFKNSDKVPFEVYESYVSLLPESDRERLKKGIRTESTEELQKIIEDYTS